MNFNNVVLAFLLACIVGCASTHGEQQVPPAGGGFLAAPLPTSAGGPPAAPAPARVVTGGTCTQPGQEGCLDLGILNLEAGWNGFQGLDAPAGNDGERDRRQNDLPPAAWEAALKGHAMAAKNHTYLVMVWNPGEGDPSGTVIFGCGPAVPAQFECTRTRTEPEPIEEVTGLVQNMEFASDSPVTGQPQAVYRLRTRGTEPLATSMMVPYSFVGANTYILICSEDGTPIYPSNGRNEGLWIGPETLQSVVRGRAKGAFALFVHPSGA